MSSLISVGSVDSVGSVGSVASVDLVDLVDLVDSVGSVGLVGSVDLVDSVGSVTSVLEDPMNGHNYLLSSSRSFIPSDLDTNIIMSSRYSAIWVDWSEYTTWSSSPNFYTKDKKY